MFGMNPAAGQTGDYLAPQFGLILRKFFGCRRALPLGVDLNRRNSHFSATFSAS